MKEESEESVLKDINPSQNENIKENLTALITDKSVEKAQSLKYYSQERVEEGQKVLEQGLKDFEERESKRSPNQKEKDTNVFAEFKERSKSSSKPSEIKEKSRSHKSASGKRKKVRKSKSRKKDQIDAEHEAQVLHKEIEINTPPLLEAQPLLDARKDTENAPKSILKIAPIDTKDSKPLKILMEEMVKQQTEVDTSVIPQACKDSHFTHAIRGYLEPYIGEPFESRAALIGLGVIISGITIYFVHAGRTSKPI